MLPSKSADYGGWWPRATRSVGLRSRSDSILTDKFPRGYRPSTEDLKLVVEHQLSEARWRLARVKDVPIHCIISGGKWTRGSFSDVLDVVRVQMPILLGSNNLSPGVKLRSLQDGIRGVHGAAHVECSIFNGVLPML